jgi:glutamate synthase (NADPH/NADH) small chain
VADLPGWSVPDDRLETRFREKNPPLSRTEALREATRCLYCYDAPCIRACPTSIDIPVFIRKIATGNARGAARTILQANLLGDSCARVCPVEVLCEGSCVYVADGRPAIPIGRLQRWAMDHGSAADLLPKAAPTGRRVACVGAGPASLACAGTLALLGHSPVLYEKRELPGGLNTTGVAPYKYQVRDALREVEFVESLGVEIRTGVEVGRDVSGADLLQSHEAVFLGPGLGPDTRLPIPGGDGPGVIGATEWIEKLKTDREHSVTGVRSAAVIGGGNTAIDVARELAGLGVPDVWMVYRRGEEEMRGYAHELDGARREGVMLVENAAVVEVEREWGSVRSVKLVATEHGRPTNRERSSLAVDLVVFAIGQTKLAELVSEFPGVAVDGRGCIVADPETLRTGNPRVFAGGDALNGGKEVVFAAADGQQAARSIDALMTDGAGVATNETSGGSRA